MKKYLFFILVIFGGISLVFASQSNNSAGINLTMDFNFSQNNSYDYFYDINLENQVFTYTDFVNRYGYYNFTGPSENFNYSIRYGNPLTSSSNTLCSGQSTNGLFFCNFTITDSNLFLYNNYYLSLCNQNAACGNAGRLIQANEVNQVSAGINLTAESNFTQNTSYTYFYDINLGNQVFTYTDFANKMGFYNLTGPNENFNYTIRYGTTPISSSSTLCSGQSTNGLFFCNFTITDSNLFLYNNYYLSLCNQNAACGNAGRLIQADYVNQVANGINLSAQSFFNITTTYPIEYVTPTPENNLRKYIINNITIKIYDGNYNLDSCKVNINNQNYTMSYDNTYCTYTYSINSSNNTQTITFQGHYNYSSLETALEQRTITIYPVKTNTSPMPAYGIFSLILSVLIIVFGGFIFN